MTTNKATMDVIKYWLITYGDGWVVTDSAYGLIPDGMDSNVWLYRDSLVEHGELTVVRLTKKALDLIAQEVRDDKE
jgi:hypothetical protein